MTSQPVVHFPNLTRSAHNAVLTLVALAWHDLKIKEKLDHVFYNLPAGSEWMVADSFAETFKKLGELKPEEFGELPGVNVRDMIRGIAVSLFKRAIQTNRRLTELARSAASAKQVEGSPEIARFTKDLVTLKAILDSRAAFIPHDVLISYIRLSESIVSYIHGMPEAEALNRKIRAITKPRMHRRESAPVVAQAMPIAQVATQDSKVLDVTGVEPLALDHDETTK